MTLNPAQVWDVLVDECDARRDMLAEFVTTWESSERFEFRFCGSLGFGGKVWSDGRDGKPPYLYVTCYSEDATPERREAIARANLRLAALVANDT